MLTEHYADYYALFAGVGPTWPLQNIILSSLQRFKFIIENKSLNVKEYKERLRTVAPNALVKESETSHVAPAGVKSNINR